jgi:hypothetical protein
MCISIGCGWPCAEIKNLIEIEPKVLPALLDPARRTEAFAGVTFPRTKAEHATWLDARRIAAVGARKTNRKGSVEAEVPVNTRRMIAELPPIFLAGTV